MSTHIFKKLNIEVQAPTELDKIETATLKFPLKKNVSTLTYRQ